MDILGLKKNKLCVHFYQIAAKTLQISNNLKKSQNFVNQKTSAQLKKLIMSAAIITFTTILSTNQQSSPNSICTATNNI